VLSIPGSSSSTGLFAPLQGRTTRSARLAEYAAYVLFKEKGAAIEFVAPVDGLRGRRSWPPLVGMRRQGAASPRSPSSSVPDWGRCRIRGQAFYQSNPHLIYRLAAHRCGRRCGPASALSDFMLLTRPTMPTISAAADKFTKGLERHARALGSAKQCPRPRLLVAGPVGTGHRRSSASPAPRAFRARPLPIFYLCRRARRRRPDARPPTAYGSAISRRCRSIPRSC
jgi:hypothetical protein